MPPQETPAQESRWTISELAEEFGVTHRALRFYEGKGILSPDRQSEGWSARRRLYPSAQVERLRLALDWKRFGFSLDEVAEMLERRDEDPEEVFALVLRSACEVKLELLRTQRHELDVAIFDLETRLGPHGAAEAA